MPKTPAPMYEYRTLPNRRPIDSALSLMSETGLEIFRPALKNRVDSSKLNSRHFCTWKAYDLSPFVAFDRSMRQSLHVVSQLEKNKRALQTIRWWDRLNRCPSEQCSRNEQKKKWNSRHVKQYEGKQTDENRKAKMSIWISTNAKQTEQVLNAWKYFHFGTVELTDLKWISIQRKRGIYRQMCVSMKASKD